MRENPTFYAEPIEGLELPGNRMPYFYLHGECEKRNGYDICNANIEAFRYSLREGGYLCKVQFMNGEIEDAICFSKFESNSMNGLIVFLRNDADIIDAIRLLGFRGIPSFNLDEEDYLKSINKWDLMNLK